jgi:hypothetical protein
MNQHRYLTLLLALLAAPAVLAQQPFDAPWLGYNAGTSHYTGNSGAAMRRPSALTTADFDGDGDRDAAVSGWAVNEPTGFALLFNDGTGALTTTAQYTVTATLATWGVQAADFDGDGDADLAVAVSGQTHNAGNQVEVWKNDGAGGFTRGWTLTAGPVPVGLAAADFNGDGRADVASANYGALGTGTTISVLLSTGSGFGTQQTYAVGTGPYDLAAGDLDGDGDFDLAVASETQQVTLLFNNGSGTFGTSTVFNHLFVMPKGLYPSVALADANRDGALDVFYTNNSAYTNSSVLEKVAHLRGDGSGQFTLQPYVRLDGFVGGPADLFAADLDGDGAPELLGAHYNGRALDGLMLMDNDGTGAFTWRGVVAAGQSTIAVHAADLDGDGDLDPMTADEASLAVTVHPNDGTGTFANAPSYAAANQGATELDFGDVDGDGDLDALMTAGQSTSPFVILRNRGDGTYDPGVTFDFIGCAYGKLRDMDGDSDLDVVCHSTSTQPPYDFFTSLNNGSGQFGPLVRHPLNACGWAKDTEVADLDEDGDLDVVNIEWLGCMSIPDSARRLFISLNNGNATFAPPRILVVNPSPTSAEIADFDEDGHLDIAVAGSVNSFLRGNGDGTFGPVQTFALSNNEYPTDLVAADLDGDGHLDLATSNYGFYETMGVTFGTGNGTFAGARLHYAPWSPDLGGATGIAASDGDGDGDLDLFVSNTGSNDAAFYENGGGRQFTFDTRFGVGPDLFAVTLADVTGDGRLDLAGTVGLPPSGGPRALAVVTGLADASVPVSVSAQPVGGPVVIGPGGGSFQFTVTLTNTTGQPQAFQAWSSVTGPVNREPVVGPQTVTLPAGATVTRTLTQAVPANAPAGQYTYTVNVGTFPGGAFASDAFPVVKQGVAPRGGGEAAADDWATSGWDDGAAASTTTLSGGYALSEVYPNPSRGRASLTLELAAAQAVRIEVYDALGRRVAVVHDGALEAGAHALTLDGAHLPAGLYVVRATGEGFTATRRVVLAR